MSNPRRNFGIDGLRGLSILLVVIHHLALNFRLPLGPSWLGGVLGKRIVNGLSFNGYESVFVFFVISGFLITRRTLDQDGALERIDWRRFYFQRASRILPLLLCLLALLSCLHLLRVPGYGIEKDGQSLGGALLSMLGLHLNWYEGQTGWLPASWDVLWSLSIEEVFYLGFPILCLLLPRPALILGLGALAVSLPWTRAALEGNEIWQEKAYLPGMSAIAVGVLTALLSRRWTASRPIALGLLGLGSLGVAGVFFYGDWLWRLLRDASLLVLCGSAGLFVFASHCLEPRPLRGLGWLAGMGRLSYEIYLSHMFIVLSVFGLYDAVLGRNLAWTFLVYPPTIWLCVWLGAGIERRLGRPCASWLEAWRSRTV